MKKWLKLYTLLIHFAANELVLVTLIFKCYFIAYINYTKTFSYVIDLYGTYIFVICGKIDDILNMEVDMTCKFDLNRVK